MIFLKVFWIFLPAAFANMAPVIFCKSKFLDYPIDFGKKIIKHQIFGTNKTYRGFFIGIVTAILVAFLQKCLQKYTSNINLIDYKNINIFWFGFWLGFGALFGDLTKSLIKRRFDINPGSKFIPFDQIDWIIGANIFLTIYIKLNIKIIILSIILFCALHLITNFISYKLKIRKTIL